MPGVAPALKYNAARPYSGRINIICLNDCYLLIIFLFTQVDLVSDSRFGRHCYS